MKTAVAIVGHMRTFERTHASQHEHVIDRLKADVFISTCTTMGYMTPGWQRSDAEIVNKPLDLHRVWSVYRPLEVVVSRPRVEDVKKYDDKRAHKDIDMGPSRNLFRALRDLNLLIPAEYEQIVVFRPDVLFLKPWPDEAVNDSESYWTCNNHYGYENWNPAACNANVQMGSRRVMDVAMTLYDRWRGHVENGCPFHDETLMHWHLRSQDVPVRQCEKLYRLCRANEATT